MNNHELPNTDEVENKSIDKSKKCPYKRRWIIFFGLFLIIAIGVVFVTEKCLWKVTQQLKLNHIALEKEVQKIQQELPTLQSAVKTQQNSIGELLNQTKASKVYWAYTEASYLVQQAIYQLRLDNINNATGLLNDALDIFDTVSLANVKLIESKLNTVVKILETAPKVDRNVVINQLDQLSQQVDKLPLNIPSTSDPLNTEASKKTTSASSEPLKSGWEQIKQLVIIRHHEKPIEPLITPSQEIYLKQNLQVQLQQASLAVLYRDTKLYRLSLEKTRAWVKQFFSLHAASTQAFLKTIDTLLQVNIAQPTPNVTATLQEVLRDMKSALQVELKSLSVKESSPVKIQTKKNNNKLVQGGSE